MLEHPAGRVAITELPDARRRLLCVELNDASTFVPHDACQTSYPLELIERILAVKGPAWLIDEILRDEDPDYVRRQIKFGILPYAAETELEGRRLLDFGCGSGASTAILARMFPNTDIVAVELDEDLLSVARLRAAHYGLSRVTFKHSPSGTELPDDLGSFQFICMSAVFEHLLPTERRTVMPMLWSALEPGGKLFLFETPHRWNPIESHTTGLPINYLPDRLAHEVSRRFSKRISPDESWQQLLRGGIRGATEREVLRTLSSAPGRAELLRPSRLGLQDEADLWFERGLGGASVKRRVMRAGLKGVNRLTGGGFVPYLYSAFRKEA